jgi:predicted ATPase
MPEVNAPYIRGLKTKLDCVTDDSYPFNLAFVPGLNLRFRKPVTFFVGENGTGKSTVLEAIAALSRLPVSGGSRNELGPTNQESDLSGGLRPSFHKRPKDGYFLRAEFFANFASLLEARAGDREFLGDPYQAYGGRSLHTRSHGEAFIAVMNGRLRSGLFLFDEPESALSPQSQLALLALIDDRAAGGKSQFIIATHSPILLTYPGADIVSFDDPALPFVRFEDTSHYQITRGILNDPELYWKHLRE